MMYNHIIFKWPVKRNQYIFRRHISSTLWSYIICALICIPSRQKSVTLPDAERGLKACIRNEVNVAYLDS